MYVQLLMEKMLTIISTCTSLLYLFDIDNESSSHSWTLYCIGSRVDKVLVSILTLIIIIFCIASTPLKLHILIQWPLQSQHILEYFRSFVFFLQQSCWRLLQYSWCLCHVHGGGGGGTTDLDNIIRYHCVDVSEIDWPWQIDPFYRIQVFDRNLYYWCTISYFFNYWVTYNHIAWWKDIRCTLL